MKKIGDIFFYLRIAISVVLLVLSKTCFSEQNSSLILNLIVSLLAYLLVSYDVFLELFEKISGKEIFSEELLMVLASLGAFSLRFFGSEYNEYFEPSLRTYTNLLLLKIPTLASSNLLATVTSFPFIFL